MLWQGSTGVMGEEFAARSMMKNLGNQNIFMNGTQELIMDGSEMQLMMDCIESIQGN